MAEPQPNTAAELTEPADRACLRCGTEHPVMLVMEGNDESPEWHLCSPCYRTEAGHG